MIYPSDKPVLFNMALWGLIMLVFLVGGLLEGYAGIMMKSYLGVSWLVYCALGKALSSFFKYYMQAYHNYQRKAVTGVSPLACGFDLSGATLGLVQIQIDSTIAGEGFFLTDPRINLAKFLMCMFCWSFDVIILVQRYFIYAKASRAALVVHH